VPALPADWNDGAEHFTRLICPDCGGSLTVRVVGARAVPVFECRVGHVYGLPDLLIAKEEVVEAALWRSVYVLQELADLLPDLEVHDVADPSPSACRSRSAQASQHADQLRRLIAAERRLALGASDPAQLPL
jgi:hypothetical protein